MQTVPIEFTEGTYQYRQQQRRGLYALYCQEHRQTSTQRFEVVRLRVRQSHTWPNGHTTPEHEAYPGAHAWGTDGWTFFSCAEAQQHFDALVTLNADSGNLDDMSSCMADTELCSMLHGGQ